jgi:hypothetical protein
MVVVVLVVVVMAGVVSLVPLAVGIVGPAMPAMIAVPIAVAISERDGPGIDRDADLGGGRQRGQRGPDQGKGDKSGINRPSHVFLSSG